jgi:hypothetical protein
MRQNQGGLPPSPAGTDAYQHWSLPPQPANPHIVRKHCDFVRRNLASEDFSREIRA